MSLIDDALRRAQDPAIPEVQKPPPSGGPQQPPATPIHSWPTSPPTASAAPLVRATNTLVIVSLAILVLTVVLVIGGSVWISRTLSGGTTFLASAPMGSRVPHGRTQAEGPTSQPVAVPLAPRTAPLAERQDDFVLSGLVEGIGQPVAVINGQIVSAGERVGRATVLNVTDHSVRLRRDDGKELVLQVPQ